MGVLDRVRNDISRYQLIQPKQRVVVGVSGGADSIVLLHILNCLQEELNISLHVAHLNHMFRGEEAKEEADFVKEVCYKWGIPCTIAERNVAAFGLERGLTDEVAARIVRYQFFNEVLEKTEGHKIALAHHADDQAETILLNLLRGAGLKGLAGIAPMRENLYIRPMLHVRRKEIEQYCLEHDLSFRVDSSNLKTIYRRNKVRHQLIPLLEKEYSPGLVTILSRMAEQIRNEDDFLEDLAAKAYDEVVVSSEKMVVKIDRRKLLGQPIVLVRRILRLAWKDLRGTKQDLTYEHVEHLIKLAMQSGSEKIIKLPGFVTVRLSYDTLILTANGDLQESYIKGGYLPVPGRIRIGDGEYIISRLLDREELTQDPREYPPTLAAFDADKIDLPLLIRPREEGDTFIPNGLGKRVKLKKFLIDRKVPRYLRDRIPLVVEEDSERIIWVAGIRAADGLGITADTKKVILLSLENGNDTNTQIDKN